MKKTHTRTQPPKAQTEESGLLPTEKSQAVNAMIRITQSLIGISEKEAQFLAQNDLLSFAILQDEKQLLADQYVRMSTEFRAKVSIFRGADKTLLQRLEKLQNELSAKARENNSIVGKIAERAQTTTQSALLAAQEMGQKCHIAFPATQSAQGGAS